MFVATLDQGRFAPRLNRSNKLFSTKQGQPREGGSSYGPSPPHITLNSPIPNLYFIFYFHEHKKEYSITNKKTIQQKVRKETLQLMLDIKIV